MKIRFATDAGVEKNIPTWFAVDTDEVVAFQLNQHRSLFLWLRGMSDPVVISPQEIGEGAFDFLLSKLCEAFSHEYFLRPFDQ